MSQSQLLKVMTKYLQEKYDKVIATKDYVVAEGSIPAALIAHLDTVGQIPPRDIYYDNKKHVMWSPQLLGADDRAGVFAIVEIIEAGYRPSVILTTDEEKGCLGAQILVDDIPQCPFDNIKALIQLDRRGKNDCVFYDCDNKDFTRYIKHFGFKEGYGSFSDISVFGPEWGIAAVNLSIGYLNEHNPIETLNTNWMQQTIEKVKDILNDIDDVGRFKYIARKSVYNNKYCMTCGRYLGHNQGVETSSGFKVCSNCYMTYFNFPIED